MLAYLFFHRPAPGVDVADYEQGLRRFHEELAEARSPGFVSSRTYRVGDTYCDWYLIEGTAAMEPLNEAAVTGARAAAHDAVAHHAVDAAGKLLMLAAGRFDPDAGFEIRFSKPAGMPYPDLYARLEPWTKQPGVSLWRRMMVLGPPPEFCLLAPSELMLPAETAPAVLRREPV